MRLPPKDRVVSSAVIFALAAVLIVLAVLQYRWSKEISQATSERMQAALKSSMMGLRQDLYHELASICFALQPDPSLGSEEERTRYIQRYQDWSRAAQHSGLVENIFLWQAVSGEHPQLLRLNVTSGQFESAGWPAGFEALRARMESMTSDFRSTAENWKLTNKGHDQSLSNHSFSDHQHHLNHHRPDDRPLLVRNRFFSWQVDQNVPALVRSVVRRPPPDDWQAGKGLPALDWIVIALSPSYLRDHVMPELVTRDFGGAEYQVAVIGGGEEQRRVIYSSDSQFGGQDIASADATLNIFAPLHELAGRPPMDMSAHHSGLAAGNGPAPPSRHAGDPRFPGPPGLEAIHYSDSDKDWQLIARNRKGPLETVVTGIRHRNMALSFGVLLLLAASMGMIIIASQRAQRLARLQMDFVAAISHELRTPLAVICSAADNIADGLVDGKEQLAKYGSVIKNQGQQLNQLVEQILLFAATRQSRNLYNFRPLQVAEILDAALNTTTGLIQSQHVNIESHIEPGLPPVVGDLSALSQCLQNLITNAVKYGGEQRWIGIRALLSHGSRGKEVQISIEDKGLGIDPSELPRIFEPFYRSPAVTSAQIHGTGLGLPLAQSIAEAMGGRLTVESTPGKGSIFTLHVPVADIPAPQTGVALNAAANPKYS
jgi:signal transduction histidine kinase